MLIASSGIFWQRSCFPIETVNLDVSGIEKSDKESYTLDSIGPTKYDDVAIASYAEFLTLWKEGTIPAAVRFSSVPSHTEGLCSRFCATRIPGRDRGPLREKVHGGT